MVIVASRTSLTVAVLWEICMAAVRGAMLTPSATVESTSCGLTGCPFSKIRSSTRYANSLIAKQCVIQRGNRKLHGITRHKTNEAKASRLACVRITCDCAFVYFTARLEMIPKVFIIQIQGKIGDIYVHIPFSISIWRLRMSDRVRIIAGTF